MIDSILSVKNFSFTIEGNQILKNIDLNVRPGEILSIIGPNGAGKTTLIKCLDRLFKGGEGNIKIFGKSLSQYTQRELAQRVSYVPQANEGIAPFTVYEFVMMGRYPYQSPFSSIGAKDKEAVQEALTITETIDLKDRSCGTLSGGERQKVLIAAALAQEADILLLDEPTTFLDPRHEIDILRLLAKTNQLKKMTMLIVTHDINNAIQLGHRILALRNGGVAFCGKASDLMNNQILQSIFDKPFQFLSHPQTNKTMVAPEVIA